MESFLIVGGGALSAAIVSTCSLRAPTTWLTRHDVDAASMPASAKIVRLPARSVPEVAPFLSRGSHVLWALGGAYPSSAQGRYIEAVNGEIQPLRVNRDALARADVRSLTYISSGGVVYGELKKSQPHVEADLLCPATDYGRVKARIEAYLAEEIVDVVPRLVVVRPGTIYGVRSRDRSFGLIEALIANSLTHTETPIYGGERAVRDFVFVDDVTGAVVELALSDARGAFNVATGVGSTPVDVASELSAILGIDAQMKILPRRPCDIEANVLDIAKVRSTIPFNPVSLPDGLKRAVARVCG